LKQLGFSKIAFVNHFPENKNTVEPVESRNEENLYFI
jgi:hypothetical protein